MSLERLRKRMIDKGATKKEIDARLERRRKVRNVGTGILAVGGQIGSVLGAVPLGGVIGKVVTKIPAVREFPVVKSAARVAAADFELQAQLHGTPKAIMMDLAPVLADIQEGEYLKAGLSIAALAAVCLAVFLLV